MLKVEWSEVHLYCMRLADKLDKGYYKRIFAVSRGGLFPSLILSHLLDIKLIETICVESYKGDCQKEKIKVLHNLPHIDHDDLVVDDIVDSGNTIQFLKTVAHPVSTFVAMGIKVGSEYIVDFYGHKFPKTWILFPWEVN